MKKKREIWFPYGDEMRLQIRKMKLTVILLFIVCVTFGNSFSQIRLTVSFDKTDIREVLQTIEERTNYIFLYKDEIFDFSKKVSADFTDARLEVVLKTFCDQSNISYEIRDRQIILKEKEATPVSTEQQPQKKSITGSVTDSSGGPLPGVSVVVKGSTTGTITDNQGNFSLQVPSEAKTLLFSFVGMRPKEIQIAGQIYINALMEEETIGIDEVVAVGYGTQSRKFLASSTEKVSAVAFKGSTINTPEQALQGRTTGVEVVNSSGEPGASAVVRIRGNNSLSGNNEPLYVIDGFPMPNYREAATNINGSYIQNGLYGINPNDIDNIEVLKDASATAIYGSRGANGVILITTKAGTRGEGRVEFVSKTSIGHISNPIKMMNSKEYADVINQTYELAGNAGPFGNIDTLSTNTDWFDAISRESFRQDLSISVSGGGEKSSYYVSGNYLLDQGIIKASGINRASIRANFNNEVNSWYRIKGQLSLVRQKSNRAITASRDWPNGSVIMDALRQPPTLDINYLGTNSAGIPGYNLLWFANPVNELDSKTDLTINDFSVVNIENWFRLIKGLQLVVTLASNQNLTRRQIFMPASTQVGRSVNGTGSNSMANTYSYNANGYFLYEKNFNEDHKINTTLGAEYNNQVFEALNTSSSGYDIPFFGVNNISSALSQQIGSYKEDRKIQSAFFRANYSYKMKYILNTSLRMDGASPFAEKRKYGVFPSVAAAWNMNEEEFMKTIGFMSNTKLRASYGVTGSQAISPYSSLSQYRNSFYQIGQNNTVATVLFPSSLGNANLSWERTKQYNFGLDLGFLKNNLIFSFDYYNKLTTDLLQPRALPAQSGFDVIIDNYGSIRNRGLEFSFQADIVNKEDLGLSMRLNMSKNKNILVDLGDRKTSDYIIINGNLQSGTAGILTPGEEIGRFFGYKVIGLAQNSDFNNGIPNYPYPGQTNTQIPGTWKYEDFKKDGKIDSDDRQVLGKSSPDFSFGYTTDFRWKNLGVNLFFNGSVGNDILNLTNFYINNGLTNYYGIVFNQTKDWYDNRWTASNPHNDVRYPSIQNLIATSDMNSVMVEDGSYIRLKTLTLSYGFPNFKVVKNLRLFVTGTNIFTLTKYHGFDPEVSSYDQSLLQQGIDFGAYPVQRTFTFGLSCNF